MKNKKGFTLTEILLAVMIVGLIGVSLAALTRSAARESGAARSRIVLRNNLSSFMRTLRADIMSASKVVECAMCTSDGDEGTLSLTSGQTIPLLRLEKNKTISGDRIISQVSTLGDSTLTTDVDSVLYCFENGTDTTNISPTDAIRGGKIYRYQTSAFATAPTCAQAVSAGKVVLNNVKYIPSTAGYAVPMVGRRYFSRDGLNSMLRVNIITELNSNPIVNETVEETFIVPIGY